MNLIKEISDLALAAYLSCYGFKIVSISYNGKRVSFHFAVDEPDETCIDYEILKFHNRNAMVDALTYSETLRNLKSMIYVQKGEKK